MPRFEIPNWIQRTTYLQKVEHMVITDKPLNKGFGLSALAEIVHFMPFGLKNVGATYPLTMNAIFHEIDWSFHGNLHK